MAAKKERRAAGHGPQHVTSKERSVILDLFSEEEAIEHEIRSTLLRGIERWLLSCHMTQTEAARALRVSQARISDIKRGKISHFSTDMLVRLAARAGLRPVVTLSKQ